MLPDWNAQNDVRSRSSSPAILRLLVKKLKGTVKAEIQKNIGQILIYSLTQ